MRSFHDDVMEYHRLLQQGAVQHAYRGLLEFMLDLRARFEKRCPGYAVPGSVYFGYMDMTYFAIVPPALKPRRLKIAVVFVHPTCRFEVWLSGANRQVQAEAWKLIRDSDWERYPLVADPRSADAVIESVLAARPDFHDLEALASQIEQGTLAFIQDVEGFLAACG